MMPNPRFSPGLCVKVGVGWRHKFCFAQLPRQLRGSGRPSDAHLEDTSESRSAAAAASRARFSSSSLGSGTKGNAHAPPLVSRTRRVPALALPASAGSVHLHTFSGSPTAPLSNCDSPEEGPGSREGRGETGEYGWGGSEMVLFNE